MWWVGDEEKVEMSQRWGSRTEGIMLVGSEKRSHKRR